MLERMKAFMSTNDHGMQPWPGAPMAGGDQAPDQVSPTVLIHLLNVGSLGQQLLDRLLQTASSCQVEGTGSDRQTEGLLPPPVELRLMSPHPHSSLSVTKAFPVFSLHTSTISIQVFFESLLSRLTLSKSFRDGQRFRYSRLQCCICGIYEHSVRQLLQDQQHTVLLPLLGDDVRLRAETKT